ncbi:MAG: TonB-dependent receptor [Bacteroidales bacterium]|nr:TonB-dependent receptor [Bacteroidales bacterium]
MGSVLAQKKRLYGAVRDDATGETLSGATVVDENATEGVFSNAYGYYTLQLPAGSHRIRYSFVGYESQTHNVHLTADTMLDIRLKSVAQEMEEVTIRANRRIAAAGVDVSRLSIREIRSIPAFLGEPDVLRSLQSLPGVLTSHHGTVNVSVRGGSYSQNLVILDEAPVYNPSHILGFMSSFNPDAISTVDLYKGVPARYGSKLSSVVDIRMKEGNRERLSVAGGIGLISSRLAVEAPLWKGKGSFMVAGRYCYAGSTVKLMSKVAEKTPFGNDFPVIGESNKIWFYDVNVKGNYAINSKNHIYVSGYNGFDQFFVPDFSGEYLLEWGNSNGTLRWNHIVNPSLFINTSFIVSRFGYSYYLVNDGNDYRWDASLGQIELKSDADHTLTNRWKLRYGFSLTRYGFVPGDISPRRSTSPAKSFSLERKRSFESGWYAETDWEFSPGWFVNAGARLSTFSNIGPGTVYTFHPYNRLPIDSTVYDKGRIIKTFAHLNPRLSLRWLFGQGSTLTASYVNMVQYMHKASNSALGMPTDIWFPASEQVSPQLAHQFSLHYRYMWGKGYTVELAPYYKRMTGQVDFRDNADIFINPYLEAEVFTGKGASKGIELMIEKTEGRLTGRISYTLSETTQKIQGVNNGNAYPAPYDSRHNLSSYFAYRLNTHWTVSADFKYATGRPVTVPVGSFLYLDTPFALYSGRNNYRVDDFHELNLSIRWTPRNENRKYRGNWTLSVMNVYNRKNVFSIYMKQNSSSSGTVLESTKMYLYGILPMISYDFKF